MVSTHSRPKAAGPDGLVGEDGLIVSTHSRPKAAGMVFDIGQKRVESFNTQPPEGGWRARRQLRSLRIGRLFQHTAARRRLVEGEDWLHHCSGVSTHSRPKAAGPTSAVGGYFHIVSTHSRPKAAGFITS